VRKYWWEIWIRGVLGCWGVSVGVLATGNFDYWWSGLLVVTGFTIVLLWTLRLYGKERGSKGEE